jgi:predicted DNA-binding transcriptional regulator AlpA
MRVLFSEDLPAKGVRLHNTTIWRKERDGQFPKHILIGNRRAWIEHEIDAWLAALIRARDSRGAEG